MRLPAFHIVAANLHMTNRLAKVRFDFAVGTQRPHCQLRDLVIKINKTLNNHPAVAHPATGHRVVPRFFHIARLGNFALTFA